MKVTKVFIISDTHFPFHQPEALENIIESIKQERPTHVVQIGDLLDQYVFSKYTKSPEITPEMDVMAGVSWAQAMWKRIKDVAPKAKCYQLLGNHDMRLAKRISERLPELANVVDYMKFYKFSGVTTMKSDRDYLKIGGVTYCHGWLSKSIDHAKYFNTPCVHGHRHKMAIETDGPLWSMDVGYMADSNSLPLSYTASKFSRWTTGCGIVENGKPRLIFF